MFRSLFVLHVLGGALLMGWVVFDSILRTLSARQRSQEALAALVQLSMTCLAVAHASFALSLLSGVLLVLLGGGFSAIPHYIEMKIVVALGTAVALAIGARSVRRTRRALRRVHSGEAAPRELESAFAATGTWMRLVGFGYVLNLLLGLIRPGG